jgi:Ca2+-binding EF-hand superfamily protein
MKFKTLAVLAAAAVAVPVAASAETPARGRDARIDRLFERYDLNKDGKITRDELKQYREAQFKAADTDGNGHINSIEMAAYVKAQINQRLEARFTALDKDKNGKITLDEMRSGRQGRRGREGRRGRRGGHMMGGHMMGRHMMGGHMRGARWHRRGGSAFWYMDRDGDGAVSKEEFMRAAQRRAFRRVAMRFARLDDNRNGLISKVEFVDARTRLFRRFDANDDSVVTREEVQTAMANSRRRFRGQRRWHHHRDGWGGGRHHGWGRGDGRGMPHRHGWPQDN